MLVEGPMKGPAQMHCSDFTSVLLSCTALVATSWQHHGVTQISCLECCRLQLLDWCLRTRERLAGVQADPDRWGGPGLKKSKAGWIKLDLPISCSETTQKRGKDRATGIWILIASNAYRA